MTYSIPFEILQINGQGYHIMVVAELNSYKLNLIVDTGATLTVFDTGRLRKVLPAADIKPWNKFFMGIGTSRIETQSTLLKELRMGDCVLENREVILIDLQSINQAYAAFDLPRIDGVIGGDILVACNAVVNYASKQLLLHC